MKIRRLGWAGVEVEHEGATLVLVPFGEGMC